MLDEIKKTILVQTLTIMKHVYFLFILIFSTCVLAQAQISIDKFSLPQKGDVLKTKYEVNPMVEVGTPGADKVWDFSNVNGAPRTLELLSPSEGSVALDDAEFLTKPTEVVENYFKADSKGDLYQYYIKTVDPLFQQYEINTPFTDDEIYRKANINFGDSDYYISRYGLSLAWTDLPDTLTQGIPLTFDSVRFSIVTDRQDVIDAYGKVKLPDGKWDVLREKSIRIRKIEVAGYSFGTWIPIPSNLLSQLLGQYASLIKPDTSYHFNYYSDKAIETVATVISKNLDGSSPSSIEYKDGAQVTNVLNVGNSLPNISAFPNPTYGMVEFTLDQVKSGDYTIVVYNILGKTLWEKNVRKTKTKHHFKADLSSLQKGTYLYSVLDNYGSKLVTKRLVIINP